MSAADKSRAKKATAAFSGGRGPAALVDLPDQILEVLPAAVYVCAADGTIVRFNRRAAQLWGREPRLNDTDERFCGSHRMFSLDGSALPHRDTPMADVLRTGEAVRDREAVIMRPDGSRIVVLINIEPLRDGSGRLTGAINCFVDITDRKRIEASARESAWRFHEVIEAIPTAVYTTDAEGRITRYNTAAAALWGGRPAIGKDRWCGPWRLFWPDGTPMPHDKCPMTVALKEGRPINGTEALAERSDGSRVLFIAYPTPLRDPSGAVVGAVNMLVDITDRKRTEQALRESERRLRATYERAFAGIAETGLDGRFVRLNARYCELTGHSAQELLGRQVLDVTHPDDVAAEREHFERLLAGEIEHYQIEKRFLRKNGEMGWAEVSVTLVPGTSQRPPYVIRIALDLSERKRAEIHQRLLLEEVNHRVKNSLAAVKAIAEQTQRSVARPELFYEAFTARLLTFSRAHDLLNRDAWRGALLDDILRETLHPFDSPDGGRIRIAFEGSTAALRFTPAAAVALGMVCHEMATNAAKYGSLAAQDGTVEIACAATLEARPRLRIEWVESGGPPVHAPARQGFGTRFIQRSLAHQFDGAAEIDFAPSGLRYRLVFPIAPNVIATDLERPAAS